MKIYWRTFLKHRTPEDKHAFPVGSRVYTGFQGNGKTLSMVAYAFEIKEEFPECEIFSNVILHGLDYHLIKDDKDVEVALGFQNGAKGVLVLLDEAHLYFNKKNGISVDVLTAISQQRKDRRRIVFSSQIWEELDISLRKQVKEVVKCKSFLNMIILRIGNGETLKYNKLTNEYETDRIEFQIYKKNDEYYNRYDTYQKIVTNKEYDCWGARAAPSTRPTVINLQS